MQMVQEQIKYIIEICKNGTWNKFGVRENGEWETIKDEFGFDLIFDSFREAYDRLKTVCPGVSILGKNVGRVREVVVLPKLKNDK